jgi:hypothetical protein
MEIDSHPQLRADDDLRVICREIVSLGRGHANWDRPESREHFQSGKYFGGYDAAEQAFVFTYCDLNQKQWWIVASLPVVEEIAKGEDRYLDLHDTI